MVNHQGTPSRDSEVGFAETGRVRTQVLVRFPQFRYYSHRAVHFTIGKRWATREDLFLPQPLGMPAGSVVVRGFIARNGVRAPVCISVILRVAEHTDEGPVRFPG